MLQSCSQRPHSALLTLILLSCFRLLFLMYTSHSYLLSPSFFFLSSSPSLFYFTSQNVYLPVPPALQHNEECATKRHVALYRAQIARHIADTCNRARCGEDTCREQKLTRYEDLPETALENMVIDKQRHFLYTAVTGAFGTKWSKLMAAVNRLDGGSDNLVTMSDFVRTNAGRDYLSSNRDHMFKFYFVRNPLDRVISGYFYYFVDMNYASKYLNGSALNELAQVNNLDVSEITSVTFEQYMRWIVYGTLSSHHFGLQSDIIQPCSIKYTLNGIFEILTMERLFVANHVLDLKTAKSDFSTNRDLRYLQREAQHFVRTVQPDVMTAFYDKFHVDYQTWNYSKPGHWFYPFPGIVKSMRMPKPAKPSINDFPRIKDLTEEDLVMLEELKGEVERREGVEVMVVGRSGGVGLRYSGVVVVVAWLVLGIKC